MKPFMYYALNKREIEAYLSIELNGNNPHLTSRSLLVFPVRQFIESHGDGLDEKYLDDYIQYICDHISSIRD